jgi:type I restriction enzyme S subunit
MSQWKKVRIGDFLKRKRVPVVLDERTKYKLVTVRLYHKGIVLREEKLGSLIKSNMYKVSKGDFILSGIDARNGAFGIIPEELDGAIVTNDFWYFDIDESIIKREYFLWLTSTPVFLDACQKASKGETQRIRLQKEAFFDYEINCPTVEYQDDFLSKIIPVINKIEEVKKQTDQQLEYTKLLRQNILQDAIEGKLTADWRKSHPVINGNPDYDAEALFEKIQKGEGSPSLQPDKPSSATPSAGDTPATPPFAIPYNWKWVKVGQLGSVFRGSGIKRSDMIEKGKPVVRYGELYTTYGLNFSKTVSFISEDLFAKSKVFSKNTVIFTLTGENRQDIAKASAYLGDESVAASGDLACWINHHQEPLYLSYFMASRYFLNEKKRIATGDFIIHISAEKIKSVVLPLPPLKEQEEIVNKVESLLAKVTELENQIQERKTLSEKLAFGIIKENLEG